MPRDGGPTREAILDAAERLTLERGFAGAPLGTMLATAGVTKGAFFHHFGSKQGLADALIDRWARGDAAQLEDTLARAERLVDDPVQQLLVLVGLFLEEAERSAGEVPGCLFAAYAYQAGLFEPRTRAVLAEAMLLWRRRLRGKLDEAVARTPPVVPTDLDALADAVTVVFEGAYVVARSTQEPGVLAQQLRLLRSHLALTFGVAAG